MQTSDYLTSLQNDKQNLATKLTEKGVTVTGNETFTELVPKLDEIQGGGGDASEYFDENMPSSSGGLNGYVGNWIFAIKKVPPFYFSGVNAFRLYSLCEAQEIDLSNTNITNITTSLKQMFYNCQKVEILDLSNFDTSNVIDMGNMFCDCKALINIIFGDFDTSKVTNMQGMFSGCGKLVSIPLLDGSSAQEIYNFCYSTPKLSNFGGLLNVGKGFKTKANNLNNYTFQFYNANGLTHDSLINIINNLYDLNLTYGVYDEEGNGLEGTLYTQKLQIGTTNMAKLTAEEIAIATNKGWSVS